MPYHRTDALILDVTGDDPGESAPQVCRLAGEQKAGELAGVIVTAGMVVKQLRLDYPMMNLSHGISLPLVNLNGWNRITPHITRLFRSDSN